ncbi:MAG: DUF4432 family protein [Oligoflexales bacterium]
MITLSNDLLKVVVRPEIGGRVDDIVHLPTERNWLWHPAYYEPGVVSQRHLGQTESFDEFWGGGWDEMFPSDATEKIDEWSLPDHGDLWRRPWEIKSVNTRSATMTCKCQSVDVNVEKTVALHPTSASMDITYRFKNNEKKTLPFLFKLHPAIAIEVGDEFLMPTCQIEPVALGFSKIIGLDRKTTFPSGYDTDGQGVSIARARPYDGESREFVYASNLSDGWCAIYNQRTAKKLVLRFDTKDLPFVWLFQSFGGFNGHYVAMLEPATTMPYSISKAMEQNTCARLEPGETKVYEISASIQ